MPEYVTLQPKLLQCLGLTFAINGSHLNLIIFFKISFLFFWTGSCSGSQTEVL